MLNHFLDYHFLQKLHLSPLLLLKGNPQLMDSPQSVFTFKPLYPHLFQSCAQLQLLSLCPLNLVKHQVLSPHQLHCHMTLHLCPLNLLPPPYKILWPRVFHVLLQTFHWQPAHQLVPVAIQGNGLFSNL